MISSLVYNILSNASVVTAIVSNRIYPDEITQSQSTFPCVVYRVSDNRPTDDHDGPSKLDWRMVDIYVYARTRLEADATAVAVRTALDGYKADSIPYIWYVNDHNDFDKESKLYTNTAEYKLALYR